MSDFTTRKPVFKNNEFLKEPEASFFKVQPREMQCCIARAFVNPCFTSRALN